LKGFKFLVLGTIFAKLFGVMRELLILSGFGYSEEASSYFSLIAILGVLIFFSDTSIITLSYNKILKQHPELQSLLIRRVNPPMGEIKLYFINIRHKLFYLLVPLKYRRTLKSFF